MDAIDIINQWLKESANLTARFEQVHCGDVEFELYKWSLPKFEIRCLINKSGHFVSVRTRTGHYWILSESEESRLPTLTMNEMSEIQTYSDKGEVIHSHQFICYSESGSSTYLIDTDNVTCTCKNFQYRCTHKTLDHPDRQCKHIKSVYLMYPDLLPDALKKLESAPAKLDGKVRYPREIFDIYVSDIKSIFKNLTYIKRFEFTGSFRRLCREVSDLDILLDIDQDDFIKLLDYLENVIGWQLVPEIGRGTHKAGYLIDGLVRVDLKRVPTESWAFALLHFTGSKDHNIEMRRIAGRRGLKLNEYGLFRESDNTPIPNLNTEEDIFKYLQMQYKHPWDR